MSDSITPEPPLLARELRELRLPTIMANWKRASEEAGKSGVPYAEYLADLVHHEILDRHDRRVSRLMPGWRSKSKASSVFSVGNLASFTRRLTLLELARGDFVTRHENVVLLGEIGTGKTHLASAIGFACCQRGFRVRFMTAADLTTALIESKSVDRLSRKLDQLARYDLIILDELGYVPFDRIGADLLFTFVTRIYEQRSLIVTTNLPFPRWSEVFQDATAAAAVIDRVVHHSTILQTEGKSYRLETAEAARLAAAGEPPS